MPEVPSVDASQDAINVHARPPVVFDTALLQVTMLVPALQLALRHPQFPPALRAYVEEFLREAIAQVRTVSPVMAHVLEAGDDPAHDVEG